jgi:hypothetical protein
MANPASRQELIDYALRRLGAPVLEVNVDEDQLEDRVDEALQYFQEYNSDGIVDTYLKYQITATDVTNGYIDIPDQMTVVRRVLPDSVGTGSGGMFNVNYQMALNDAFLLRGGFIGNLAEYSLTQQYITLMNGLFGNATISTRFNRHMNRLHLDVEWGVDIKEDDWIIVEGSAIVDPATYTDVYNDMFVKRYVTALIKRQWGQNMSKFEGMQLPGGVTMNGMQILEQANEEILKIEEEMQLRYEMPVDFYMG